MINNTRRELKRIDNVETVRVIKVTGIKGKGTPQDPVRHVIQYWDLEGNHIVTVDVDNKS